MEWELSKENVQPLKGGRNVEVLNDALKAKAEGPARSSTFDNQRRQFLEAIENYVGEDPLVPWTRYIKWINDACPAGGTQSELLKVLEQCTRQFQKDERYRRDVRYLRIWVQYADCCSDPSDVFAFLEANDIGQDYALFYEAYATSMEVRRKFSTADEIYNLGLQRSAQPMGRLESMYKTFLHRMLRRGARKSREEQQAVAGNYNENDVQSRSFGTSAVSADAEVQQARRHRARPAAMPPPRQIPSRAENAALSVFVDPEFGGPPTVSAQEARGKEPAAWCHIGTVADKRKENVQQPSKWSEAKIGQEARGQHGPLSDLKVLVDDEFSEVYHPKAQKKVPKNAAPSLSLRHDDVQKIPRHPLDLKGSFLDPPEAFPASTTRGPTQFLADSSKNIAAHDTSVKSHPETVFGYNVPLLNASGTERCFEEVRLSVWNERRPMLFMEDKENSPTIVADPKKSEVSHLSPQPSFSPDTDRVKESLFPAQLKAAEDGSNEPIVSLPSSSSEKNVDGDDDASRKRAGHVLENSYQQVTNHMMSSDGEFIVDCLSREPAAGKEDHLTDCQLQPQETSSRSDQPPIVLLNSFSMQGDETVAIRRFAEEVIVLGSDPKVNSIDAVSHHGLVEPTINTKEALADILDMFNKPLESDSAQSKVRKPKETKKRSSDPTTKSSGFEIFVDEDLGVSGSAKTKNSDKRPKAMSGRSSAEPVLQTRGFHSFADENSGVQKPRGSGKHDRAISRPFDSTSQSTGFDIYVDEDLDFQGPSHLNKSVEKHEKRSSNSSLDPGLQPGGFSDEGHQRESKATNCTPFDPAFGSSTFHIFEDDDLIAKEHLQPGENDDSWAFQILADDNLVMKRPLQPSQNDGLSPLQIFVDDDLVVKKPLQPARHDESSSCQSIHVEDELGDLSLNSNELDADHTKSPPQNHLSLVEDKCTARDPSKIDDSAVGASTETTSKDLAVTSEVIFAATSEVNVATPPMTVNPWDESHQLDLLERLRPQIKDYEGFLESNEKYSGSIPISSFRNSNARNKVLQLGSSTYRLKGCVGQGTFGQVFEVEDEEDDHLDNPAQLALKFQKPACPWEFYIYRQLDMRVSNEDRCYYGQVRKFHLYSDSSFLICNYGDKGTLQDVVNAYLASGQRMEETLCMFYTIEMLRILETLHGAGIIHGDFKPDNVLIRDDSDELEVWNPDRRGCWKSQGLCLVDWGRSIDLTLYPEGVEFVGDCKTDAFRCSEMLEGRPWRFQGDTFGLCGVVHCLLHGTYMQIEKSQTGDGQTIYRPRSPYRRYWNVELWRGFFETLLNVNNSLDNPPLRALRKNFEDHLTSNSLGKKVKELLAKQTIMMFIRR